MLTLPRREGSTLIDLTSSYLLTHETNNRPHILVSSHNGEELLTIPCNSYEKERYPRDAVSAPDDLVVNGQWLHLSPYSFRTGLPPLYLPRRTLKVQVMRQKSLFTGFVLRGNATDPYFLLRVGEGSQSVIYLCSPQEAPDTEKLIVFPRLHQQGIEVYGKTVPSPPAEVGTDVFYGLCYRMIVIHGEESLTLLLDGRTATYTDIDDYRIRYDGQHYTILLVGESSYQLLRM